MNINSSNSNAIHRKESNYLETLDIIIYMNSNDLNKRVTLNTLNVLNNLNNLNERNALTALLP